MEGLEGAGRTLDGARRVWHGRSEVFRGFGRASDGAEDIRGSWKGPQRELGEPLTELEGSQRELGDPQRVLECPQRRPHKVQRGPWGNRDTEITKQLGIFSL